MTSNIIRSRPLGKIEQYGSVRHDLNCYQSFAESAVYKNPRPGAETSLDTFYKAIKVVIAEYPNLSIVIHDENTDSPYFGFPKIVDLKNHVIWLPELAAMKEEEETKMVAKRISSQFKNIDTTPPWNVTVIPRGDMLSVTFFSHHAPFDGTSGKLFLLSLLKAFNQNTLNETFKDESAKKEINSTFIVPESFSIPPSLEQVLDMPLGFWKIAKVIGQKYDLLSSSTNVWSGSPITNILGGESLPSTNIAKFSISSQDMNKLQKESKIRKTSISSLITAIAVTSVSKALPIDAPFSKIGYSIARNLRPTITTSNFNMSMGVYVSTMNGSTPRSAITPTKFDPEQVWQISSKIKKTIQKSLNDGNYNLDSGLLRFVNSMRNYFIDEMGRSRGLSLEVSSLVISEAEIANSSSPGGWTMDDLYFYQCANVFGAPLDFSSLGYKGSALNITCVWGTGVVEDEFVEKVLDNYKTYVRVLVDNIKI